jgi:hypothetical protein
MINLHNHPGSTVINQYTAEVQHNYAPMSNQANIAALLVQIKKTLDSDQSLSESRKANARSALTEIGGEIASNTPPTNRITQWAKTFEGITSIAASVKALLPLLSV